MSNITSKIIKHAINNDEEAFNVIFEEYKHTVFYITKKYLRNVQDTEECVQDFFVKLWRIIPTYCEQLGNFETWLLAFSAGAMIYVTIEELLPEARKGGHEHYGLWAFMLGFLAMLALEMLL